IRSNSCKHRALHVGATGKGPQSLEYHRMVANDEPAFMLHRLGHHRLGTVQGDQGSIHIDVQAARLQAAIVVILLQGPRCPFLQDTDHFLDLHHAVIWPASYRPPGCLGGMEVLGPRRSRKRSSTQSPLPAPRSVMQARASHAPKAGSDQNPHYVYIATAWRY